MAIECYFDDSGKQGQKDHNHVVIAGYLGHDGIWWAFQQRWHHQLMRHDLKQLHLREFPAVAKERGWNDGQRRIVLGDFVNVIRESQLIGMAVAVDAGVWRKLSRERLKFFGTAEQFCFQRVLRLVGHKMDQSGERDDLWLTFDNDFEFSKGRLGLFEYIHERDKKLAARFASIAFASARRIYALQAADLLAWNVRRELHNQDNRRPSMAEWDKLFAALPTGNSEYHGELWTPERIEAGLAAIEADPAKIHQWATKTTPPAVPSVSPAESS